MLLQSTSIGRSFAKLPAATRRTICATSGSTMAGPSTPSRPRSRPVFSFSAPPAAKPTSTLATTLKPLPTRNRLRRTGATACDHPPAERAYARRSRGLVPQHPAIFPPRARRHAALPPQLRPLRLARYLLILEIFHETPRPNSCGTAALGCAPHRSNTFTCRPVVGRHLHRSEARLHKIRIAGMRVV